MTRRSAGWADLLRSLGRAFQDLVRSELAALGEELSGSARRLAVIAGLFLLALFGLFWALGLLAFFAVELLVLWGTPRWAAALGVFGVALLAAGILAAVAWSRLRKLEKPGETVRRRVAEHVAWWETRILGARGESPQEALPSDSVEEP